MTERTNRGGELGAPSADAPARGAARRRRPTLFRLALATVGVAVLVTFYVAASTRHAEVVNLSKARADQTGYLWDAQQVYANWHGRRPPMLIGERVRMVVYPAFLALLYDPSMSDPEFFEAAKRWSIGLSVLLLAFLSVLFFRFLSPLVAANLALVVAFGYFVFRAGYSQPELLFYTVFFAAFLACFRLFAPRTGPRQLLLGVLAGALIGLAHLTKALGPPFVAVFLVTYLGSELAVVVRHQRQHSLNGAKLREAGWRLAAGAAVALTFLAVVWPYISNSKRAFGEYFYNTNTTYFMWYDDGIEARAALGPLLDKEGRLAAPPGTFVPTLGTYVRTHTAMQVLSRLGDGFEDMVVRSYQTFWLMKYVVMYLALFVALAARRREAFRGLLREQWGLASFLVLYAIVYLCAIAFFCATSSTGTMRFLLAHVAPLLFVLSRFFLRAPFRDTSWSVGGAAITTVHAHLLISATLALDLVFTTWPRVISTYGGF